MATPFKILKTSLALAILAVGLQTNAQGMCMSYGGPAVTPATTSTPASGVTYVYRAAIPGIRGPALSSGASGSSGTPAVLEYLSARGWTYSATTPLRAGNSENNVLLDMAAAGINLAQPVSATVILDLGANQSNWCTSDTNPAGAISFAGLPAGSVITLVNNGTITADYSASSPAILLGPGITLKLDNTNGIIQNNAGATGAAILLNGGAVTWLGGNTTSQVIGTVQ